jgi:flagellar FliJ protein
MARDQLALLIKLEGDKEQALRKDFSIAQQHLNQLSEQLNGLSDYRRDYIEQLQVRGQHGIGSSYYSQFQLFVAKIEQAIKQQVQAIETAKQVVAQRQGLWLKQKQKLQAIEKLAQVKAQKIQQIQIKNEQKQMDEFSAQAFSRAQSKLA